MTINDNKNVSYYNNLPQVGDIVWCSYPEEFGTPGPKCRPALVIGISSKHHAVSVVYGTSKKLDRLYSTEILLDKKDQGFVDSGLSYSTKFDLANSVQLPFTHDWFSPSPCGLMHNPLPKMGVLHISYYPALAKASKAIKKE
jgi:hypothetical protein